MRTHLFALFILTGLSLSSFAQNVGIGTTTFTPNDDALLELRSTTSGFLMPKMTEVQRDAIVGPTEGLIIYQTNVSRGFKYYNGSTWVAIGADNLGEHLATQNLSLNDNWLTNDGGSEGIRITNDGNVGVGTATPGQRLQVQVNTPTGLTFPLLIRNAGASNGGGSGSGIGFNNHNAGNDVKTAIFNERITNYGVGKLHVLMSNTTNSTPVTLSDAKMTIQADGKVGIGTTSPTKVLDVKSNAAGVNVITVQNTTTNGWSSIDFNDQAGDLSATFGFANSGTSGIFTNKAYMNSYDHDFVLTRNSSEYSIFIGGASGNIGLGTNGPSAKLDVNGSTRLRGLTGSGTRMVVADANGNLSTQNITDAVSGALDEVTRAVSGSSSQSTTSSSYSDLSGMSLSVEAGRYIFQFNCDMEVTNGNTVGAYAFEVNGTIVSESVRKIKPGTNSPGIATLISVVDVASTGTVKVRVKRDAGSGTVTTGGRTLMVMKISN